MELKPSRKCWLRCTGSRVALHHKRTCSSFAPARWYKSATRCKAIRARSSRFHSAVEFSYSTSLEVTIQFLKPDFGKSAGLGSREYTPNAGIAKSQENRHCSSAFYPASAFRSPSELVFHRALPVDDIAQSPRVLVQIELQFSVFVDNDLSCRIQSASALALVLVVQLNLAGGKVKAHRLRLRVGFAEGDLAVRDELDRAAGCGWDHTDEAHVVAQRSGNLDAAHCLHLLQGVGQSLVLSLLEGINEDLAIFRRRELVDDERDPYVASHLGAGSVSCG